MTQRKASEKKKKKEAEEEGREEKEECKEIKTYKNEHVDLWNF